MKFSELFGDKDTLILYSFMFGPNWDKPCPSCTSLMDGFDRTWYSVAQDAAFAAIAKAPAEKIDAWAKERGWSQIPLLSGYAVALPGGLQVPGRERRHAVAGDACVQEARRQDFPFLGTETMSNHVDTVWPYWNLLDFTPEGRPDRQTPPQRFRCEFLEKNYLNRE